MTLNRHTQRTQQTLGSKEIHDNPLSNRDRLRRNAHRLVVQSEIDDELFRSASNAAEIRIRCDNSRIVEFDFSALGRTLSGIATCWFSSLFFFFFCHTYVPFLGWSNRRTPLAARSMGTAQFGNSQQLLLRTLFAHYLHHTDPCRLGKTVPAWDRLLRFRNGMFSPDSDTIAGLTFGCQPGSWPVLGTRSAASVRRWPPLLSPDTWH